MHFKRNWKEFYNGNHKNTKSIWNILLQKNINKNFKN